MLNVLNTAPNFHLSPPLHMLSTLEGKSFVLHHSDDIPSCMQALWVGETLSTFLHISWEREYVNLVILPALAEGMS